MYRFLIVCNDNNEYHHLCEHLSGNPDLMVDCAREQTHQGARNKFNLEPYDVYIIDTDNNHEKALALVQEGIKLGCEGPMILLTEEHNLAFDKKAIAFGAADVLPKNELSSSLLRRSIQHALERKKSRQQMAFLATHDSLTKTANKTLLNKYLVRGLAKSVRSKNKLAVLAIGMDRLQLVNNSLGHDFGDQLIRLFAQRLNRISRNNDTLARVAGDEFILLIESLNTPQQAGAVANKLLQAMAAPFNVGDQEVYVSASIGIAVYPDDGEDPETLLKSAYSALHRAKEDGRNTFALYSSSMNASDYKYLELGRELRHALVGKQFHVYYQPQVDVASGRVVGAEALLRWQHPSKGWIGPDQFIPIVEESGLMSKLGEWVIRTVAQQVEQWQEQGKPTIRVAINISGRQIKESNLIPLLKEVLSTHQLDSSQLELELTEGVLIDNVDENNDVLMELRRLGFHLAIDDFGTGYSSLSYLKHFPINVLKIDQCFIKNMMSNSCDRAIVESLISLAHKINVKVIAEGVETQAQLDVLTQYGCDEIQGYFFSKPLPIEAFNDYLESHYAEQKAGHIGGLIDEHSILTAIENTSKSATIRLNSNRGS